MSIVLLAGDKMNVWNRGTLTVSTGHADFPGSNLADGRPSRPWRAAALASDILLTCDGDILVTDGEHVGKFDTAAHLAAWTGTGTLSLETTDFATGPGAGLLTSAGSAATRTYVVTVRAGERLTVAAKARGGTAAGIVRVRNRKTGSYLTSAGAWQASSADYVNQSGASYASTSNVVTVESFPSPCLEPTADLEIVLTQSGAGTSYYDDIYVFPSFDWMSVHGHNIDNHVAAEFRSSTDAFSASDTLEATLTKRPNAFHAKLSGNVDRRYTRLKLAGTQLSLATHIGEVVVGQSRMLTRAQNYGWRFVPRRPQVRSTGRTGEVHAYRLTEGQPKLLEMSFLFTTQAEMTEVEDEVFERTLGGVYPLVMLPDDSDPRVVVHGRILEELSVVRYEAPSLSWEASLRVDPSPFFIPSN